MRKNSLSPKTKTGNIMLNKIFNLAIISLFFSCSSTPDKSLKKEIIDTINESATAWNNGDLDAFMSYYKKTNELRFAANSSVNRGWEKARQAYVKSFADKNNMDLLKFSEFEVELITNDRALVFGRFTNIKKDKSEKTGLTTLYMIKENGSWKILYDHSSD